ncbi:MAG TPA: hypothetical protein VGY54_21835 [Polyangiaceae bacterium]|jgi:hypothetical protein|nr:hypothetical protein [Polyangiaceae bacterium]
MQPSYRFGAVAIVPLLVLAGACSSGDFPIVRENDAGTGSSSGDGSGASGSASPGGGAGATSSGSGSGAGASGAGSSGAGASGAGASGAGSSGSGGGACTKSSSCPGSSYCHTPDGQCSAAGTCQAFDPASACIAAYQPVCGCDGKTYGNSCAANVSGVSIASQGACAGTADGGCVQNALCTTTSHWDRTLCRCVPDTDGGPINPGGPIILPADGGCVQNVLCTTTSHWDRTLCRCVPNDSDAGGPNCGSVRCPAGDYCCNPLQSLCAPPGVACIA